MNRRQFLTGLAAALAGSAVLDPERLLWVPGQRLISIPKPRLFGGSGQWVQVDWEFSPAGRVAVWIDGERFPPAYRPCPVEYKVSATIKTGEQKTPAQLLEMCDVTRVHDSYLLQFKTGQQPFTIQYVGFEGFPCIDSPNTFRRYDHQRFGVRL